MAEDNKSQNPTGQGNPPQDQNKSQGGSSASWEDALGALVEPDPAPQVPVQNIPIPPQAQPQAQKNDQNRPQGDQGALFKRKRKRRRKNKNFGSFGGNMPMQGGSNGRPQFQPQNKQQGSPQTQSNPRPQPQFQPQSKVQPQVVEPVKEVPLKKEEPLKEELKKEEPAKREEPKKEEARPTWEEALHSMAEDKKENEDSVIPSTWEDEPEESSPPTTEKKEEVGADLWADDVPETPQVNEVDLSEPEAEPEEETKTEEPEESEEAVPESEGELVGEENDLLDEDKPDGVTKKHLFIGIGCVVLFIVALVIGFFVLKKFVFDKVQGTSEEETQQEEQVIDEEKKEEVVVEETEETEEVGVAPLLHPFLAPGQSPAFVAVSRIGLSMTPEGRFVYYVDTVKRLKTLYETNLNQLLDQSYDRRASLNSYLSALKSIQTESKTALDYVVKEQTELAANYEVVDAEKNTMEAEFFNELQQLNSIASDQSLTEFTKLIRRHSSIKARHRALANVRGFYERALPKLDARIRDIEANTEALVKGIKVIDITDSDLGLIITEK